MKINKSQTVTLISVLLAFLFPSSFSAWYDETHLTYCAHYIRDSDLSQPLHNTLYDDYNRKSHGKADAAINDEILNNLEAIKVYPIEIKTEDELGREIARIANISMALAYKLKDEGPLLSREEAY